MTINIQPVDYQNRDHARALVALLDHYASDPMGGGEALSPETKQNLVPALAKRRNVFSFIAWTDEGQPIALVNCVEGFSTFAAKPICNIHDIAVLDGYRGQGIAQLLLNEVATEAKQRGCCKLTLEVLSGNEPARKAYKNYGFQPYQLDPSMGQAEFWEMKL
ncbi:MAG: GNAT family N-acetyltransferase [Idiomarina sp.]|nr:GNAT family N-acetyltransferase [Idiomarina sp.]